MKILKVRMIKTKDDLEGLSRMDPVAIYGNPRYWWGDKNDLISAGIFLEPTERGFLVVKPVWNNRNADFAIVRQTFQTSGVDEGKVIPGAIEYPFQRGSEEEGTYREALEEVFFIMKTHVLNLEGKKTKEINLPSCFSAKIRNDVVSKVLEAKKTMQPYGASPMAGKKHAAGGKVVHRRKVWRSGYGRGQSRVPRKIFSQRGSNFNWEASDVPSTKGGRRAHPPKSISMINTFKLFLFRILGYSTPANSR